MRNRLIIDLLIVKKGQSSGYQEYVFNLLNYFYKNRNLIEYKRIVIWCKDSEVEAFREYRDKFEIKPFHYNSYLRRFWLQTILPVREKLTYDDLLFSPGNTSGFIKRSRVILTIHDLLFKRKEWLPKTEMRWQRSIFIPSSIKKADRIVAISNFTKNDIEYYYPKAKGKIEVIYNSINFEKFEDAIEPQFDNDYFLAICSNAYHKNLQTVLKAFKVYCEKGGDKDLIFVGNFSHTGSVASLYESFPIDIKNRIVNKSGISNAELGGLYKGASCYITASLFEGLGMPVVEAMSFGLPLLLSNIPPHREVSLGMGVYFDPFNVEELSYKMLSMDFHKRNYSKDIRQLFDERNTSGNYVCLINQMSVL